MRLPLSVQGALICESPIFGPVRSDRSLFAMYSELSVFSMSATRWQWIAKSCLETTPRGTILFDNSEPLVLTHQDLNLRNVIVGEDSRLRVIDFAWAGYNPPWCKYSRTPYKPYLREMSA